MVVSTHLCLVWVRQVCKYKTNFRIWRHYRIVQKPHQSFISQCWDNILDISFLVSFCHLGTNWGHQGRGNLHRGITSIRLVCEHIRVCIVLVNDWCERVQPDMGDATPRQVVLGCASKQTKPAMGSKPLNSVPKQKLPNTHLWCLFVIGTFFRETFSKHSLWYCAHPPPHINFLLLYFIAFLTIITVKVPNSFLAY